MRQWLPGKFLASVAAAEQVGLEHLGRRAEAEALARRGIEAGTELTKFLLRKRVRIGVATKPTSQSLVGVLNRTFLPRRLRLAEPCLRADLGLQVRPVDELGSAGSRPSSWCKFPDSLRA